MSYEVAASNEKKSNWKVIDQPHFGGEDFDIIGKLLQGSEPTDTNSGLLTVIHSLEQEKADLEFKLKEKRWAMREIASMMDIIRLHWNQGNWSLSDVGRLLSELENFVRSQK